MNVMKNNRIKKGNIVLQGEVQGPAVATGTTVTSANSGAAGGSMVKLPCIPANEERRRHLRVNTNPDYFLWIINKFFPFFSRLSSIDLHAQFVKLDFELKAVQPA